MNTPDQSPLTSHLSPTTSPLGYPTNLLAPGQTYESVNKTIAEIPLTRAPISWTAGFFVAFFLLADSISGHDGSVAAIPQPARVGYLCSRHLFYDLALVLVPRPRTRSRHDT